MSKNRDKIKNKKIINQEEYNFTPFIVFFSIICYMMIILFYKQAISFKSEFYWSDTPIHINVAVNSLYKTSYPLYHFLIIFLSKLPYIEVTKASAIVLMLCNACSILIVRKIMINYIGERVNKYLIDFTSIILFFLSALANPFATDSIYLGTATPNPWHNPTYLMMRPFGIITLYIFSKIYHKNVKRENINKEIIIFSLMCIVTTLAKPSFVFVFFPAMTIWVIIDLIRMKFKNFLFYVKIFLAFIPTVLCLIIQYKITYGHSEPSQLAFKIGGSWSIYSANILLSILLALAFPIFILIINLKTIMQDKIYLLTWIMLIISILQYAFFCETGPREADGNLGWGYLFCMFVIFAVSIIKALVNKNKIQILIANAILSLHVFVGLYYFWKIYEGLSPLNIKI